MSDGQSKEFIYEGATAQGQKVKGRFRGDRDKFLADVRKKGITILKVKQKKISFKSGRFTEKNLASGIEELRHLINSGMKLDQALQLVVRTSQKGSAINFWQNVLKSVKTGKQFSVAIRETAAEIKLELPAFYTNVLSVGEEVGDLGLALVKLKDYMDFKSTLISEIKSALAYPAFLLAVSLAALALIFGLILPTFSNIFGPREMEKLPSLSILVFHAGKSFREHLGIIVCAFCGLIALVIFFLPVLKKKALQVFLHLPVTRGLVLSMDLANIFTSFGMMLNGGIDLAKALRQTARVARLPALKSLMEHSIEEVKKGNKLSAVWTDSHMIPPDVISLVIVGENSARLGDIMQELGTRFLVGFKRDVKSLTNWLEPVIILVLGGFVGFIVVAIALALVSINEIMS
jgi:type II secretory pathway component PulF